MSTTNDNRYILVCYFFISYQHSVPRIKCWTFYTVSRWLGTGKKELNVKRDTQDIAHMSDKQNKNCHPAQLALIVSPQYYVLFRKTIHKTDIECFFLFVSCFFYTNNGGGVGRSRYCWHLRFFLYVSLLPHQTPYKRTCLRYNKRVNWLVSYSC